jgi:hypothetical protein
VELEDVAAGVAGGVVAAWEWQLASEAEVVGVEGVDLPPIFPLIFTAPAASLRIMQEPL